MFKNLLNLYPALTMKAAICTKYGPPEVVKKGYVVASGMALVAGSFRNTDRVGAIIW
jgi:hypothetical protein